MKTLAHKHKQSLGPMPVCTKTIHSCFLSPCWSGPNVLETVVIVFYRLHSRKSHIHTHICGYGPAGVYCWRLPLDLLPRFTSVWQLQHRDDFSSPATATFVLFFLSNVYYVVCIREGVCIFLLMSVRL